MARTAHGVYATADAWPDDYYLLALRNDRFIFFHESTLYLHLLTEREPAATSATDHPHSPAEVEEAFTPEAE